MKEYEVSADSLLLKFKCPKCGAGVVHRVMYLPSPNWDSESISGSQENGYDGCNCDKCDRQFDITLIATTSYADLLVEDAETGHEIEDVEVNEEWTEHDTSLFYKKGNSEFQEWFEERVKTQYGDIEGVAYLDGYEGPGDVRDLFDDYNELSEKTVLGFEISYLMASAQVVPVCIVYAISSKILQMKGLENIDFYRDIEEITLENFSIEDLNLGIKRLSFGFAIPKHLIKN